MPAKMVTKKKTKMMNEIVSGHADFVSLIKHGANRQGFRVVKSDDTQPESISEVLHSVLIPKEITLESLAEKEETAWVNALKRDSIINHDGYDEVVQIERGNFDESSFKFKKTGEDGVYAIVGLLKPELKSDVMLTNSVMTFPEVQNDSSVPTANAFLQELSGFLSTLSGAVSQSQLSADESKAMVNQGWSAFGSFLSMLIDQIGPNFSASAPGQNLISLLGGLTSTLDSFGMNPVIMNSDETLKGDVFDMTKEETQALFKEEIFPTMKEMVKAEMDAQISTLKESLATKTEPEKKTPEEEAKIKADEDKKKADDETKTLLEDLVAKNNAQADLIMEMKEKMDALEKRPQVSHAHKSDDAYEGVTDEQKKKWEEFPNGVPKEHRKGLFKGMVRHAIPKQSDATA